MKNPSNPPGQIVELTDVTTLLAYKAINDELAEGFPVARMLMYCRQVDDLDTLELIGLEPEAAGMLSKFVESWRTVGLAKAILPRPEPGQDLPAESAENSKAAGEDPDRCSIVVYFDRPKDFEPPKMVVLDEVQSRAWAGVLEDLVNG